MNISGRIREVLIGIGAAIALAAMPVISSAGVLVGVSVNIAPPAIPVEVQPPIPEPGYLWVPGYWAWSPAGYDWVPGMWVLPPSAGLVWTPGYWGWVNGAYVWNAGYWGRHVGFYGGVNYGFGYPGVGFVGGYWHGGVFFYNRAVANVASIHVANVYYRPVMNNFAAARVSYNGGPGGIVARPNRMELAAVRERHVAFAPMQRQQMAQHFNQTQHFNAQHFNQTGRGQFDRAPAQRYPQQAHPNRQQAARGPAARGTGHGQHERERDR